MIYLFSSELRYIVKRLQNSRNKPAVHNSPFPKLFAKNNVRLHAAGRILLLTFVSVALLVFSPVTTAYSKAYHGNKMSYSSGHTAATVALNSDEQAYPAATVTASCTTVGAGNITQTTVTITGNISDSGGENATAVIVQWSDHKLREANGSFQRAFYSSSENITVTGTFGPGLFSLNITALIPGLKYWAIAGAKNASGWGWAVNDVSFTMTDNVTSFCSIDEASGIGTTSANISGTLISSTLTRAFGNPVIDEENIYGGWIPLGNTKTYAQHNPLHTHMAIQDESVVGYAFRTKSWPTVGMAGAGLYRYEAPNVTSRFGNVTMVTIPNNLTGIKWVYSEAVNIPLVQGYTYAAACGNFTSFWGNKTTGNKTSEGNFVWVATGAFPDNMSVNYDHKSENKYNVVAFYTTPADNITEYGFFWGTESGLYTDNVTTACNMNTGTVDREITGLTPGTEYFIMFGVKNSSGWDYSGETSFTTGVEPVLPVPELSTILMTGCGIVLVSGYLRFRFRNRHTGNLSKV